MLPSKEVWFTAFTKRVNIVVFTTSKVEISEISELTSCDVFADVFQEGWMPLKFIFSGWRINILIFNFSRM